MVKDRACGWFFQLQGSTVFLLLIGVLCLLGPGTRVSQAQGYITNFGDRIPIAPDPAELGFVENASGAVHIEIPLGSFPQRGGSQPLTYRLVYDSNIWDISPSHVWEPNNIPFASGSGWRLVPSINWQSNYSFDGTCHYNWNITSSDGSVRYFPISTCNGSTPNGDAFATDSSGYHLYVTNYTSGIKLYAPDGSLLTLSPAPSDAHGHTILSEDPNGNYLSWNSAGASLNYFDTLLRQAIVVTQNCVPNQTCYDVSNSQGGITRFQVANLTGFSAKTHFAQSGVTECVTNCNIFPITAISLPDGTSYTFKYDCDSSVWPTLCSSPAGQTAYYGTLTSVTLPTGGQILYSYNIFTGSYGVKSQWLYTRQSAGGFWTYFPQVLSTCSSGQVGCQQQLTVSKPGGTSTVYKFTLNNGLWPVQIQNYSGSGTLLTTVNNTYDFSNSCPLRNCVGASYITLSSQLTTVSAPAGASLSKKTAYTYVSPQKGNPTAIKEWKFYPGTNPTFPTVPDRGTYITYASPGTNIINRPATTTVCNNSGSDSACLSGGSKVSQTTVTYDSYGANGLTGISGIANHDDSSFGTGNQARGNPTQTSQWVSGSTFLTGQLQYDTTGQVLQTTDSLGNSITYNYTDNFFNETGASSMSSYTPSAPTNAYPKIVTVGGLSSTRGYYFGSGRLAVSTDPNNVSTYRYYSDPFDRQTQTNFPIGWTLTNYTSATQVDTYTPVADSSASSGCTSCQHMQLNLDTWGRKVNQKLVNAPGGAVNVDTTYDSNGRVQSVSHAYVNTSDPSHVFETFAYDGLNRNISVTHADSQSSQMFYGPLVSGPGGGGGLSSQQSSTASYGYGYPMLTVDETGTKKRQEWVDGFGRIIEVDEPVTGATPATGTATIGGFERSTYYYPCGVSSCPTLTYDAGTVNITVNGFTASASYGQTDTSSTVANSLTAYFNSHGNSPVTASLSGSSILLTSKTTGASTNYSISTTSSTSSQYFTGSSFWATLSGSTLTGGYDAGSSFATPIVTSYVYDALSNLTQVVQGVQTRTFTYDGLGRRTSMTTPEAGTDTFYFTQADGVSLCSGNAGAVCRKTDARGITTTYIYDSFSRLTGKTYSNGQGAVSLQYDQGGAAAFALGRRTGLIDPSGSESYTYDQAGRITQIQKTIGSTTYPIRYQYNTGGQVTQITYPSNRVVQQNVDSIGLPNTIVSGSTSYASIPEPPTGYNAAGQLLTFTYGNGVVTNFGYSAARQQMTSLNYAKGAQTLFSLNYGYMNGQANCGTGTTAGNDGLIQCIQDTVDNGRSVVYTYDALGRLNTALTTGSSGYQQWGLSWVYDRYGNRLNQNQTAGSPPMNSLTFATTPAPPANPPGGAYTNRPDGYLFDASGNMLNDGSNNLAYDAENCLTSAGTGTYTCDAHGIRVKKALQGSTATAYIFSAGNDIAEYDNGAPATTPSREYIYLGGTLIATIQGSSTVYHHADHLSVRVTTDANGNKIGEQGHYPYGETWYVSNTTTKFFFTSYERDSESGNDYAMARFYINRFGRFSCVDPSLGAPGDPQSWNRYAYARNNPVNITDPSGQFWLFKLFGALLAILGILFQQPWLVKLGMAIAGAGWGIPNIPGSFPGTPPTFPDPLGNTQATLNSIYHPMGRSPLIIENLLAAPGPQQNPCQKFSQSLADRLYNANKGANFRDGRGAVKLGVEMVNQALADVDENGVRYEKYKYSVAGFKPELVDNGQDADVYHHILGFTGTTLASMPEVAAGAWLRDWEQAHIERRMESITELRDDRAGLAVGDAMARTTRAGKKGNYADLAKQIMDILCL